MWSWMSVHSCKNLPTSMNDDKSNSEDPEVGSEGGFEDTSTSDEEEETTVQFVFGRENDD